MSKNTTVSSVSVKIRSNSTAMNRMGAISGTITDLNRCHQLAPSTRAASITSAGKAVSPAMTTIAPNGTARQVLTRMTANMAGTGVPSHWMLWSISPTFNRIQFTTLNCEWNIHFQAMVLSAIGIVHGRTNSVRRIERPRKLPISTSTLPLVVSACPSSNRRSCPASTPQPLSSTAMAAVVSPVSLTRTRMQPR